jgi:uncharacterized protein (DUF1778 family)
MTLSLQYATHNPKELKMPVAIRQKSAPRRNTLNLRIKPDEQNLIDRAAELTGKTRTDFVLEAARRAAVEAISERTLFLVAPEVYAEFLNALEAPPCPSGKLSRTMQTTPPWIEV